MSIAKKLLLSTMLIVVADHASAQESEIVVDLQSIFMDGRDVRPFNVRLAYWIDDDSAGNRSSMAYVLTLYERPEFGAPPISTEVRECEIETEYQDILRQNFFPRTATEKGWHFRFRFPACNGYPPLVITTHCPAGGLWQENLRTKVDCVRGDLTGPQRCQNVTVGSIVQKAERIITEYRSFIPSNASGYTCTSSLKMGDLEAEVGYATLLEGSADILNRRDVTTVYP